MKENPLGRFPTEPDQDAVHVAYITATCSLTVYPGQALEIVDYDGSTANVHVSVDNEDGIVDPFLPMERILPGTMVRFLISPRAVTGMTHQWQHPKLKKRVLA